MSPSSTSPAVLRGAEPFAADLGPVGALVLHGFTGSPYSVRPWAEHLATAGMSVRAPRLPGHGTTWRELNRTGWLDWYGTAEAAFAELASRCSQVFVVGLSMGACLALRLAETQGARVAGVVAVNPSLAPDTKLFLLAPVLKHVVPYLPGIAGDIKKPSTGEGGYSQVPVRAAATLPSMWRTTGAELGSVTAPVLVFRSTVDHVVGPASMEVLQTALPGAEIRPLADSYHVATLDNDAPEIFAGTLAFIQTHTQAAEVGE